MDGEPVSVEGSAVPIHYVRSLAAPARTRRADRHLGLALAFVAGAINAGGFLAVHRYTSHMTGIVSGAAERLAAGAAGLALDAGGAMLAFLAGAACTAVMVNHARRRALASTYALPLLLEALLLLAFGMLGARLAGAGGLFVPATVMLLCFMMGLQNALMTKLSHAEIRTTHMTGIVTDIGIELGKLPYRNADGARLGYLCALLASFFAGGVAGALGFRQFGWMATLPLAAMLVALGIGPALEDVRALARRGLRRLP